MLNNISLIGRLTANPEERVIKGTDTKVATFTLAVERNYKRNDGTKPVDFIPCEIIGGLASVVTAYASKGRMVSVTGALYIDRYQINGTYVNYTKVNCNSFTLLDKKPDSSSVENNTNANQNIEDPFQPIDEGDIPF